MLNNLFSRLSLSPWAYVYRTSFAASQAPESAMINSWLDLWFLPGIFTGMGSLFAVIGGIPLVKSFLLKT
jgi:hypothetical protein